MRGDMTRKITTIMCTTTEIQKASRQRERSRSSSSWIRDVRCEDRLREIACGQRQLAFFLRRNRR